MEDYKNDTTCPICQKDMHGVFNYPQKLIAKKKNVLGRDATWYDFAKAWNTT